MVVNHHECVALTTFGVSNHNQDGTTTANEIDVNPLDLHLGYARLGTAAASRTFEVSEYGFEDAYIERSHRRHQRSSDARDNRAFEMLRSRTLLQAVCQTRLRAGQSTSPTLRVALRQAPHCYPCLRQQRSFVSASQKVHQSSSLLSRWQPIWVRRVRNLRQTSNKSTTRPVPEADNHASRSLSDRFKELSRKYGWAAVGVYFGLSALDFPFCFLAVRLVGPERIGEVEHAIIDGFWKIVGIIIPSMKPEDRATMPAGDQAEARQSSVITVNGVREKEDASMCLEGLCI